MPKTRSQKAESLKSLEANFKDMKSVIFVRQDGLNAVDTMGLRRTLREAGVGFVVVKKTLVQKALKSAGLSADEVGTFAGTVSAAFGMTDELTPAKVLNEFAKTHESVRFLGGIVSGAFMNAEQALAFAKLPGKKELMAMFVSVVSSPLRGFVGVLQGNLRGLVYALKAIQEKKPV